MGLDVQVQQLQEQGYVLLPGVIDLLQVALLRCAIDDLQPIHWDYQGSSNTTSASSIGTRCGCLFSTCHR